MFLEILDILNKLDSGFNVLHYLTVRAVFATLTALLISMLLGKYVIKKLSFYQVHQVIREDGPPTHLDKLGTPTMGGVLILFAFITSVIIWSDWSNHYVVLVLITSIAFGIIGFLDDFLKISKKKSKGLGAKQKYLAQSVVAIFIAYLFFVTDGSKEHELVVPFIKEFYYDLGFYPFIIMAYFTIVGSSNAVNLTDGLDGLAIMPVMLIAGTFGVFAYISGNYNFANYLAIPFIPYAGEIVVVCAAIVGASLGFLWFNSYPANIFMGDVGSLPLGAILAVVAISLRQELLLIIAGGIFVLEAISVILQVGSYKIRKKRIFLMAPIHHHFEQKGWSEPKIIVRFWVLTMILCLVSLSSLKIR